MVDLVGILKAGQNVLNGDLVKVIEGGIKLYKGDLEIRVGIASNEAARLEAALEKNGFTGFDQGGRDGRISVTERDKILAFRDAHPELAGQIEINRQGGLDMVVHKKGIEALEKGLPSVQQQAPQAAPAAPAADNGLTVRLGEPSELAGNVEKFMKANKLPVKENGILSAAEADVFKAHIAKLEQRTPALKGQITVDAEGNITFTPKALGLLDIDAPKATVVAPAPTTQAPATQAPATAQAPAAAASAGEDSQRVKDLAREAVANNFAGFKAANKLRNICGDEKDPDFNSQVCQDRRGGKKNDGQGR